MDGRNLNDSAPAAEAAPARRFPVVSVRTRIIAVITLVAALGLVAVGVSVYTVERQRIMESVDQRLAANLESARFIVVEGAEGEASWASSTDALRAVVQRMSPDDNTGAVGLIAGEIAILPGIALDVDLRSDPAFARHVTAQSAAGEPVIGTFAENDVVWRYLAAPIAIDGSPEPTEVLFVLAYDLAAELSEFDIAGQIFIIASLIVLVVIAATGTVVATRLLRPLRQMRQTAERVSAHSLSERLPIEGRDDVSLLAATMNGMLDRLDSALESQRSLLSDVGHELKTPITIVRGYVEVMDPDSPDDVRETQSLAVDELERMGTLVQDLAAAAALHGPAPVRLRPVDTADLMRQIIRKAEGIQGATVMPGPIADVVVPLDSARITQAVLQLAQNGVTHGGGRLVIGSTAAADRLEIWVRDYGPGVPDAAKNRVFDRFHRTASAEGHTGSGLGLAIVQVIARAHGGSARVLDAGGGGAVFVISVPRVEVDEGYAPRPAELVVPPRPPMPSERTEQDTQAVDRGH